MSRGNICLVPGYVDQHPSLSSAPDDLHLTNSYQITKVKAAMTTVAAPSATVSEIAPEDGKTAARPISCTRRQLPVPQISANAVLSLRSSPPKSLLLQTSSEKKNPSANDGVTVQVEMERQVKVEMVKQIKVKQNCDPQSSAVTGNGTKILRSKSPGRNSVISPLESPTRRLNPPMKVNLPRSSSRDRGALPLPKSTSVPVGQSGSVDPTTLQKDKSEEEKPGVTGAPPAGVQYNLRKGAIRQLPNMDLVKQARQKEIMGRTTGKGHLEVSRGKEPQQQQRSISKNSEKISESGNLTENGKTSKILPKSTISTSKQTSETSVGISSKIKKLNSQNNSSISSSASSSITSNIAVKRPLHLQKPARNFSPKRVHETIAGQSLSKAATELKTTRTESKVGGWNKNQALEKSNRTSTKSQKRPTDFKKPAFRQVLLSTAGRDSSSSRRTSVSSISSSTARSETLGQTSLSVQDSCSSVDKRKADVMSGIQYHNPPDIISNSMQCELPISKLHQMEVQYKLMENQMSTSSTKAKQALSGFEAMTVVAKHFFEQIESLSETISALRSQIVSDNAKHDVLTYQRNALIAEIQSLKEDHEVQVNGMTVTHQMELHAFQEKAEALVKEVEEQHAKAVAMLHSESLKTIEELKTQHRKEMETNSTALAQQVSDIKSKYKQKISDLQRTHDNRLKDLKTQFEALKSALAEKIERLNLECNELRQQNLILIDGDPEALSSIGNSDMEKEVETLTQEIESLKVVLELRNEENNKLRKQNVALETQLEELVEAKQKIRQLEQKLENTEAVVHMKAEYERELAEKHTTLLRRYNQESKVNKRLSMNNEELMWKLNQVASATATSPKVIRRTLSGPPTKSAPGTPLLVRRSQPEMNWESYSSSQDNTIQKPNGSDSIFE